MWIKLGIHGKFTNKHSETSCKEMALAQNDGEINSYNFRSSLAFASHWSSQSENKSCTRILSSLKAKGLILPTLVVKKSLVN
jgi:hypothetical protein